jgi:L-aminopeptidase/D-esterase-like protein
MRASIALLVALVVCPVALQAQKPRERDLKLPIGGTPGTLDAITDVAGVEVGQTTLISGSGKLVVGKGPGAPVTVIHPRGKANRILSSRSGSRSTATGDDRHHLQESDVRRTGEITNTHSVGVVRDAIIQ